MLKTAGEPNLGKTTPYVILGVPEDATDDEISAAYRRLSLSLHPDATGGDPAKEERFKAVAEARRELREPDRRRALDDRLRRERAAHAVRQATRKPRSKARARTRRRPPVTRPAPAPAKPASATELAISIARNRPQREALEIMLFGLGIDVLLAALKVRR